MFHDIRKVTQEFVTELENKRPDLLPHAGTLAIHFRQKYAGSRHKNHLDAKIDAALHVVLAVLAEPCLEDAAARIAAARHIKPEGINVVICDALTDALPHSAEWAAVLQKYGFLHVRDRFFLAGKDFEPGGVLDSLCRSALEKYPQAAEEALYQAFMSRGGAGSSANPLSRAALPFLLLRLASAGQAENVFWENSLTLGVTEKTARENNARIAPALRALEVKYGIQIPGPGDENTVHTPPLIAHVPVYAPGATVSSIPASRHGTPVLHSALLLGKRELVSILKDMIAARAYGISVQDGQIYLAYNRIPKKITDPASRLTARFDIGRDEIENAYNRVAAALVIYMQSYAAMPPDQTLTSISRAPSVQSNAARTGRSG